MSRSIHKTVKQVVRDNSKAEIDEPGNLDLAELAKKSRYKNAEAAKRLKAQDIQPSDSATKDGNCSAK